MHADQPEIVAIGLQVDEVLSRVLALADLHRDSDSHDITIDLDEVERGLRSASRRLNRLERSLR